MSSYGVEKLVGIKRLGLGFCEGGFFWFAGGLGTPVRGNGLYLGTAGRLWGSCCGGNWTSFKLALAVEISFFSGS